MRSRFFFVVYAAAAAGLVLYGVLALAEPGVLLQPFLLRVYRFPAEATGAIAYLSGLYRLLGFLNLIPGILGLILLRKYAVGRPRWLLYVITASLILTYLGPIVFDNTVGSVGTFEIIEDILFAAMILAAALMLTDPRSS